MYKISNRNFVFLLLLVAAALFISLPAYCRRSAMLIPVAEGWAKTSVNGKIFRRNSVATHGQTQYTAFYDKDSNVVLAKRQLDSTDWEIRKTQYKGNTRDAHNSISIIVDGEGYLHIAWDHHGHPLRYCRSLAPGSLELGSKVPMTGQKESHVTYPEFYNLPDGNLLFAYRDGGSGNGNLMLNHYDTKAQKWSILQDTLVDGEGHRNAYWQMFVDSRGTVHLSWVWRESGDVATNHDLCYARSEDGGKTWTKTTGETYQLPITLKTAEYAFRIPQNSDLINQTSMYADAKGRPYIVTYWTPRGTGIPQYHLAFHDGLQWKVSQISQRVTPFSLKGGGTRAVPISRPQIVIDASGKRTRAVVLFRDIEQGECVSAAVCKDMSKPRWRIKNLTAMSVQKWEPSYDTDLWQRDKRLNIFVQCVSQVSGERAQEDMPPQMVYILDWKPW